VSARREKPSSWVRVRLDLTIKVTKPVDGVPFGGQEAIDAFRQAGADAAWKLLPPELRNKNGVVEVGATRLSIAVDRRKS
jgi:hypothetical protein